MDSKNLHKHPNAISNRTVMQGADRSVRSFALEADPTACSAGFSSRSHTPDVK